MGGPYPIPVAGSGLIPTVAVDVPITTIFLFLFVCGAVTHMTILQVNFRRGKKFLMSGMTFGFCMARIAATVLRIVWSTKQHDLPVIIAAQIFMAAGVLLLFIINLIFTQRVFRAAYPNWAWSKGLSIALKVYYASIVVMLIALITATIQSFYTLSHNTRRIDRDIQLVGSTYFAVCAFLPIILFTIYAVVPKTSPVEKFGEGRLRTKIAVIIFSSFILSIGAAFRAGIAYVPRPANHPAWYHSKACFYIFNFVIDITVVALFAFIRIDKRFHVPNGSHGPGDYSRQNGRNSAELLERKPTLTEMVLDEEEVFDNQPRTEKAGEIKDSDVEASAKSSKATL